MDFEDFWRLWRAGGRTKRAAEEAFEAVCGESPAAGTNAGAFEETLSVLNDFGRLEKIDAARVQSARSLAAAVDVHPAEGPLWLRYRQAVDALMEADSDIDDRLSEALKEIGSASAVGDS